MKNNRIVIRIIFSIRMLLHIFPLEEETPETERVLMFIVQNMIHNFEFGMVCFPNSTATFETIEFPPIPFKKPQILIGC